MTLPFEAALMAERNRNRVYDEVVNTIELAAAQKGVNKTEIARRLGKKLPQISRLLSGPSNWTLDTISHLLFAIDAEMDYQAIFNEKREPAKFRTIHSTAAADSPKISTIGQAAESASTSPAPDVRLMANNG